MGEGAAGVVASKGARYFSGSGVWERAFGGRLSAQQGEKRRPESERGAWILV